MTSKQSSFSSTSPGARKRQIAARLQPSRLLAQASQGATLSGAETRGDVSAIISVISTFALNAKVFSDILNTADSDTTNSTSDGQEFYNAEYGRIGESKASLDGAPVSASASVSEIESQGLASIQCERAPRVNPKIANDFVYWFDIPSDHKYMNPFQKMHMEEGEEKYFVFEKDRAGWNNVRMSFETLITLGISMGRTIVLPPAQTIYMMGHQEKSNKRDHYTFHYFYHLNETQWKNVGVKIISMTEFLERVAERRISSSSLQPLILPPGNRTNYDNTSNKDLRSLYDWLNKTAYTPETHTGRPWDPKECIAFWPSMPNIHKHSNVRSKATALKAIMKKSFKISPSSYDHAPYPVNAPVEERLAEHWGGRKDVCMYHEEMQKAPVVYFNFDSRMLIPFYTFHFYEDWKQGTWTKRFVRDNLRYRDEIICAAARVLEAIQQRVAKRASFFSFTRDTTFSAVHIRRGDFKEQYSMQTRSIHELYQVSKDVLKTNTTLFIATDEHDKSFFEPLKEYYDICFLDDFHHLLKDVDPNYFGFIDQMISAKGDVFIGTYYSTFSAFVVRMRGYYSNRDGAPGHEMGELPQSFYFWPEDKKFRMTTYFPLERPFWSYEHPFGWRKIDKGVPRPRG